MADAHERMHGISSASGSSPTRCASTCWASRRRCAPTPARGARTRSSSGHRPRPRPRLRALPRSRDRAPALRHRGARGARLPAGADRRGRRPRRLHGRAAGDPMAKTLFAVDELSGFVAACALVRPTGIEGMKPKSVKKKLKQPSFAAGVNRDEVQRGIDELGVDAGRAHRADHRGAGRARGRARARARSREPVERLVQSRWLKITLGVIAGLVVLLLLNTVVVTNATKSAYVRDGRARRSSTPRRRRPGRSTRATSRAAPIVLIHCYTCSLHWWDDLAPLLERGPPRDPRRPARPRRLGEARARLLDRGPGERRRRGAREARRRCAVVVGHSLGGSGRHGARRAEPAARSRVVIIDQAPDDSFEHELAQRSTLGYWPRDRPGRLRLIQSPDVARQEPYNQAFAPGYDISERIRQSRPGRRRPARDDLHVLRRHSATPRTTTSTRSRSTSGSRPSTCRCWSSSAPRIRSTTPRPRSPATGGARRADST